MYKRSLKNRYEECHYELLSGTKFKCLQNSFSNFIDIYFSYHGSQLVAYLDVLTRLQYPRLTCLTVADCRPGYMLNSDEPVGKNSAVKV